VNKLQRYEELIAAKLEQRPLPDMADAIWANIEKGLDAGPSSGNPSQPPSSPVPVAGWIKGLGILVIVVAVILAIFLAKTNDDNPPPVQPAGAPVITPVMDSTAKVGPSLPKTNNLNQQRDKKASKADSGFIPDVIINPPVQLIDSINNNPLILPPPVMVDSVSSKPPQSIPPPKKPKGVRLNSDDYKIVPVKKDS
jgi:hypothetical protein